VSKSCDECKGSFARGCEAKLWSHWTCSSLGTIFQPMRINSVPDVNCFCTNKNVLRAQSMVRHFVRHPVYSNVRTLSVHLLMCLSTILRRLFYTIRNRTSKCNTGVLIIQGWQHSRLDRYVKACYVGISRLPIKESPVTADM